MTTAEVSTSAALIWCPFPDADSARAVASQLLGARLIACANILSACESHFIWQGATSQTTETPVLFKTTAENLPVVVAQLGWLHPYDTPVIIGWRCDAAHPATVAWLAAMSSTEADPSADTVSKAD